MALRESKHRPAELLRGPAAAMSAAPGPTVVHYRPLHSGISLGAERASWRMHLALRGRDFSDEAALREFIESRVSGLLDELPEEADLADRAQDLFYRAAACEDWTESQFYLDEALACDPTNLSVRVARAVQLGDRWEGVRRLEALVAESEADLREVLADVDEVEGAAWGLLEARPALRARAALADALVATGRVDAAIAVCRDLLDVDPEDRQGARHVLVSLLVEVGAFDAARAVLARWAEDPSIFFAWARLLVAQQTGEDGDALLEQARASNRHALGALLYPEQFDPDLPDHYEPGTESEAELLSGFQWRAWHRRPEAIAWLRKRADHEYGPTEDATPTWAAIVECDEVALRESLLAFLDPGDEDVFRRLVGYIERGPIDEMWHVSENALDLLHRLGLASRAVPEVVAYLERLAHIGEDEDASVMAVLAAAGEVAVVPLLAAHDAAPAASIRERMLSGLVRTKVRSEEIYRRLVSFLDEDVFMGTCLLADYGDSRAVPLISAHLDAADPAPAAAGKSHAADLIGAIYDLGGELTQAQKARFAFFVEARARHESPEGRRELARQLRESYVRMRARVEEGGDDARDLHPSVSLPPLGPSNDVTLARSDRPGRNEPCWCGSGTKYKRCHLAADEAGDQH